MAKYKIIYDKEGCIGALACVGVAEKFWIATDDGMKADLKGATYNKATKKWELIIDEKDFDVNKVAAEVCPVVVIKIEKIED
jgi:ferredoxin